MIRFSNMGEDVPLGADLPHTTWTCEICGFGNSCLDGECQNADCEGDEANVNGSSNV